MSPGVKEPKQAPAKRDLALPEDTAQSPSLNEAQFPFSGIHDRLTKYREILCRELTQRGADPRSFKGRGIESLLGEVAAQIAQNIETAIAACPPHDLPKLKQAISNATELDGDNLLSGRSFAKRSEDDLRSTSFEEWRARIDGEIRTRVVIGDASEKGIKGSLAGILRSDALRSMLCGLKGYQWASELFSQGRMLKAHLRTSATCKKVGVGFESLGWEASFPGTTKKLEELSKNFRDPRYKGLGGYVAFSNEHAEGDMKKGYNLMSALCKYQSVNFDSEIGWEASFPGTTKKLEELSKNFRDPRYKGLGGYVAFSNDWAEDDMQKGYQLMSALCKYQSVNFDFEIGWEAYFPGTTKELEELSGKIRDPRYKGLGGYVAFANDHAKGNMNKGYQLMSALCKYQSVNFDFEIGWEAQFPGTTKKLEELSKNFREPRYKGLGGYVAFANEHAGGDMQKGYVLMSALCKYQSVNFDSEIEWEAQFPGTTKKLEELSKNFRDPRYKGLGGYVAFSNDWAKDDMQKGYNLMSALCKYQNVNFDSEIGWEAYFPGTTKELEELSGKIRDPRYKGLGGYVAFANDHAKGDMNKGYRLMSALCKYQSVNFDFEIGWEAQFQGTTKKLEELSKNFRDPRYKGLGGYVAFANEHAGGDMQKGYELMSALCKYQSVNFDFEIGWEAQFPGTTKKLEELSKNFRDPRYKGLGGYVAFSNEHAEGDMKKGYNLMSALCKYQSVNFDSEIEWEAQFLGTTKKLEELSKNFRDPRYKGLGGYVAFSNDWAEGDMQKGHKLMSALCKYQNVNFDSEIGWEAKFPGTTKELEELSGEIRDPRYKGLGGYVAFSNEHAGGDMQKGYVLMSALCKYQSVNFDSEIEWEAQFPGTTKKLEELSKNFRDPRYKGLGGYVAVSNDWAEGDMQKGYKLMTALCKFEEVDFDDVLEWPPLFTGTVKQYTFIQQSLLEHAEGLAALKKVSKDSRLVALHRVLQTIPGGDVIADLPLQVLFAALPEQVSIFARGDFSPACLRLVVGADGAQQTVYFDSAPERICGYLLHRYGFIKSFLEKENLHVRPSQSSRITLDFKVRGRAGEAVFIEYHPLSRRDLEEGISLEEAGRRKKESVADGEFAGATVHHIWELEQLFDVVRECDAEFDLSFEQFLEDIKEAKALGRKLDQEDAQHLAEVLKGLKL